MVELSTRRHIRTPTSSMFQQDIIRRLADWRENVRIGCSRAVAKRSGTRGVMEHANWLSLDFPTRNEYQ